jgi:hypothetical protein
VATSLCPSTRNGRRASHPSGHPHPDLSGCRTEQTGSAGPRTPLDWAGPIHCLAASLWLRRHAYKNLGKRPSAHREQTEPPMLTRKPNPAVDGRPASGHWCS